MVQKRSLIAGLFIGGVVLIFGLFLMFAQDWVWSWFEFFYSMVGIQAQQSRFWSMFISTIGLAFAVVGTFQILAVWRRWRSGRE